MNDMQLGSLIIFLFVIGLVLSTRGTYHFLKSEWSFRNDKKIKVPERRAGFYSGVGRFASYN